MRFIVVIAAWIFASGAVAQKWEDRRVFNEGGQTLLRVISSTDTDLFSPVIEAFVAQNAGVGVEYLVTGTADIDRQLRTAPGRFDLVISSAMDLQLKLANDGYARRVGGLSHPSWAAWRDSLFAFTSEPAAIVINRADFEGVEIPKTRQDLIVALRARPDRFRNRVGTYDARVSGLGYLFATQDARASETFWRLMEVMGGLNVRLYCCSGAMIDDLKSGKIAVAYNVLGSYAAARIDQAEELEIILPSDFPTTMMRTAMISADAPEAEAAEAFLRHLIAFQATPSSAWALPPLGVQATGSQQMAIPLEPALMTFLDAFKRRRFLSEWEDAVIQQP